MKLKLTRLCALLLTILTLTAIMCACSPKDDKVPENMQHATIAGSDYRLFLPIDWNLLTDTGISGGYASMQNKVAIYVKVYDNPQGLSVQEFWTNKHQQTLADVFSDGESIEHSESNGTTLGECDAYYYTYQGTRDMVTYTGIETLCAKDGKIYVLSFCARQDLYEGYLNVFDTVKTNFLFSDTPFVPEEPISTVDPDAEAPAGMQLASNDDVAYRFYVPESWVLDTKLTTSSAYVSESDRSNVNVTVYMPEVDHIETVDDYWVTCLEQLKKGMDITSEIKDTKISLDGCRGKIYEYTAVIDGKTYCFAQAITSYRGMIYTITYTATPEQYDTHRDTYQDILAAFDFRGN